MPCFPPCFFFFTAARPTAEQLLKHHWFADAAEGRLVLGEYQSAAACCAVWHTYDACMTASGVSEKRCRPQKLPSTAPRLGAKQGINPVIAAGSSPTQCRNITASPASHTWLSWPQGNLCAAQPHIDVCQFLLLSEAGSTAYASVAVVSMQLTALSLSLWHQRA